MARLTPAQRICALFLLWLCFAINVHTLDRTPPLHGDEMWILSPGYKFFTQGVFGSDLMSGFHNMERHYLQFMPLFPLVQGAFSQLVGTSVFTLRFAPICIGTLALAMTIAAGRYLGGARIGLYAAALLLGWQLMPANASPFLPSGVPFLDGTRIARYDLMTVPLCLAAWVCFARARATQRPTFDWLCGLFIGLAELTQIYSLFWLMGLAWALLIENRFRPNRRMAGPLARMAGAAFIVVLPWAMLIALNWPDALAQARVNPGRFDLLNPNFYITNLLGEPHRYIHNVRGRSLGELIQPNRIGLWLFFIGLPAACAYLAFKTDSPDRARRQRWLLGLAFVVLACFALLLQPKFWTYLPMPLILFALILAAALEKVERLAPRIWGAVGRAVLGLVCAVGGFSQVQTHLAAAYARPPAVLEAQLRACVPPNARVFGAPIYWLGLMHTDYRLMHTVHFRVLPGVEPHPPSFGEALASVAPDVVLHDDQMRQTLDVYRDQWRRPEYVDQYWAYLRQHRAEPICMLSDNEGRRIVVYWLRQ